MEHLDISLEVIKQSIDCVDKKYEKIISDRRPLEKEWMDVEKAATDGQLLQGELKQLIGKYIDIGEADFPGLVEQVYTEKLEYLNLDYMELEPRGKFDDSQGLLMLNDGVTEFVKQKYDSDESCYTSAMSAAIWQAVNHGVGIVHYCWHREVNPKKQEKMVYSEGSFTLECQEEKQELTYQGPKFAFVDLFKFYFDLTEAKVNNLYELDCMFIDNVSFNELFSDSKYDETAPYYNQASVLYRNNIGLHELKGSKQELSEVDRERRQHLNNSEDTINDIEVRTVYLKEFVLKGVTNESAKQKVIKNVCIHYAKGNNTIVPLLLEYNRFPHNKKPFAIITSAQVPTKLYSKTSVHRAFNHFSRLAYYNGLEAYTAGEAIFGTEYIPEALKDATGRSEAEFKDDWNTPGRIRTYREDEYKGEPVLSPQRDRAIQVLPIIKDQKNVSKSDQASSFVELLSLNSTDVTATRDRISADRRDKIQKRFVDSLELAIEKLMSLTLHDMSSLFTDETVFMNMSDEDIKSFFGENQDLTKYQKYSINGFPLIVEADPIIKKKYITLRSFFMRDYQADTKCKIDYHSSSKALRLEQVTRMFDLAEKLNSPAMGYLAAEKYIQIEDTPEGAESLKILKAEMDKESQPNPAQEQAMQLEAGKAQAEMGLKQAQTQGIMAKAQLDMADAEEEKSRADAQNLENALTQEMAGIL